MRTALIVGADAISWFACTRTAALPEAVRGGDAAAVRAAFMDRLPPSWSAIARASEAGADGDVVAALRAYARERVAKTAARVRRGRRLAAMRTTDSAALDAVRATPIRAIPARVIVGAFLRG